MKYIEALRKFWRDYNPFIHIKPEEIVDESKNFIIIASQLHIRRSFANNTKDKLFVKIME